MINVSSEYRNLIADYVDNKTAPDFTANATITLLDSTVLGITEEDIIINGFKIKDGTSSSGSFQIGSAIINELTLQLNNVEGKFRDIDFFGARVVPFAGLKLSNSTEWLKKGMFTVDNSIETGSIITLTCYDNMDKLDIPFSEVGVAFPVSALSLLQSICAYCQVPLLTSTFLNQGFMINRAIEDSAITCREIVSYIAQISGNYARINVDGALELKWYGEFPDILDGNGSVDIVDGSGTTDIIDGNVTDKYHHIYSLSSATVGTDDVVITGVKVKAKGDLTDYGETVLFGDTGYVIFMENPLIQENTASIIANSVGAKIVGMRFRPCNFTAIADPSREAGDIAFLTDRKQNTYPILLTNITYQIGKNDTISCDAETPSKNSSTRFSEGAKAIVEARKIARQELTTYDIQMQHLTNLMTMSFGVYKSEEVLEDGSTIYYMHDKPTLAQSTKIWKMTADAFAVSSNGGQTWNAGVDVNGNIVANVLSAIGINCEWLTAGTIDLNDTDETNARIVLTGRTDWISRLSPLALELVNTFTNRSSVFQAGGWYMYDVSGANKVLRTMVSRGFIELFDSSGTRTTHIAAGLLEISSSSGASKAAMSGVYGMVELTGSAGTVKARVKADGVSYVTDYFTVGGSGNNANYKLWVEGSAYSVGTWQTSDRNLKKDIVDLDIDKAKPLIMGLNPSSYRMIKDDNGVHLGIIAQDVKSLIDELGLSGLSLYSESIGVDGDGNEQTTIALNYIDFIAPMIKVIQDQETRINDLETRLLALESKVI